MTVKGNHDFSALNVIRPANARFGEVVCIELNIQGHYLGYSKRKSIHVPPSSNAYWNFMNLRSLVVAWSSLKGVPRDDRIAVHQILNLAVRHIHLKECMATYLDNWDAGTPTQYYKLNIRKVDEQVGWVGEVSPVGASPLDDPFVTIFPLEQTDN